jgi:hypothetical protein
MNRSASEFAFQEFLKQTLVAGGDRAKSRFKTESEAEEQKTEVPMFASTEELRAMNNVVDSVAEDDEVAAIEGALNPLFSGMQDAGEKSYGDFNPSSVAPGDATGQDYEIFLKQKLEIACAAAALSRVRTISSSTSLTCMAFALALDCFSVSLTSLGFGDVYGIRRMAMVQVLDCQLARLGNQTLAANSMVTHPNAFMLPCCRSPRSCHLAWIWLKFRGLGDWPVCGSGVWRLC